MSIELSWQETPIIGSELDLIDEYPRLEGTISDPLAARIIYKVLYLRNNGTDIAYESKFYLHGEDGADLTPLLQWGSLIDANWRSYGMFTVWGYNSTGATSYIDDFIADTINPNMLNLFSHNWTQGNAAVNGLPLDIAYRYRNGVYVQDRKFETVTGLPMSVSGEESGILRVLLGLRIPDSVHSQHLQLRQVLSYEEIA